jgi:hypothetical protein
MFITPVNKKILAFRYCIIAFFNFRQFLEFSVKVGVRFLLVILNHKFLVLFFGLKSVKKAGILGMETIFESNAIDIRETIVFNTIWTSMDPTWKFTNHIIFRVFHMPKTYCLACLFCDFSHVGYQFFNPSATAQ